MYVEEGKEGREIRRKNRGRDGRRKKKKFRWTKKRGEKEKGTRKKVIEEGEGTME